MDNKNKLYNIALVSLFTAVTVIFSWICIPMPVPFTMQSYAIFTASLLLGCKNGTITVAVYLLLGAVGLPVFSGFRGGLGTLLGPTGGFLIGFLFLPAVSELVYKFCFKKSKAVCHIIGLAVCYVIGSVQYMLYANISFTAALLISVIPFIPLDLIKLYAANKTATRLKQAMGGVSEQRRISTRRLKAKLPDNVKAVVLKTVDSTNSEAVRMLKAGIEPPFVILTERQQNGRGRRGRNFFSSGGLYMSLALPITAIEAHEARLTSLAAVAVCRAVQKLCGISVGIKWVNDIYLKQKKICGILTEAVFDSKTSASLGTVIGIGVNLNVSGDDFPSELKDIAGVLECKKISREALAAQIVHEIFDLLENGDFADEYAAKSIVLGRKIFYEKNGCRYDALAMSIDNSGGLHVLNDDGTPAVLTGGEITLRLK